MSDYDWKFSTIGGKNRVNIKSGEDIKHLGELDQKLWTVLSSPVTGLEFDAKTLKMLDSNNDGRIHVHEVVKAAEWITSVIKDPDMLLKKEDTLPLSAFNTDNPDGARLLASAKQILKNLGLKKDSISVADADDSVWEEHYTAVLAQLYPEKAPHEEPNASVLAPYWDFGYEKSRNWSDQGQASIHFPLIGDALQYRYGPYQTINGKIEVTDLTFGTYFFYEKRCFII